MTLIELRKENSWHQHTYAYIYINTYMNISGVVHEYYVGEKLYRIFTQTAACKKYAAVGVKS